MSISITISKSIVQYSTCVRHLGTAAAYVGMYYYSEYLLTGLAGFKDFRKRFLCLEHLLLVPVQRLPITGTGDLDLERVAFK